MGTLEIGKDLVALCSQGKFDEAIDKYYSDDIVSIEGAENPGMAQRMEGIEAVRGKNDWWAANNEVHDVKVEGPFVAEGDDRFGVRFFLDVTNKQTGERTEMTELALYKVDGGKIVEERFFYHQGE